MQQASTPLTVINNVLDNLDTADAVSPGLPITDTLWEVINEEVIQTKSRKNIWRAQTPQGLTSKRYLMLTYPVHQLRLMMLKWPLQQE